jgi:hypothetical protein
MGGKAAHLLTKFISKEILSLGYHFLRGQRGCFTLTALQHDLIIDQLDQDGVVVIEIACQQ